jgi:hypothetical protein
MKGKSTIPLFILIITISLVFFIQCDAPKEDDPLEGCFIATAAYGTPVAEEIDILRQFRDESLSKNAIGTSLIGNYYRFSPPIADFISEHRVLGIIVREHLVDPSVKMLEFTKALWLIK